jgi:hypothetical protein
VLVYNGLGSSNQYVDNSYSVSGTNSLHLVGSSCWSANAYHALDLPSQVSYEAMVFIDAIVNCGCSNTLARIGLCDRNLGTWGTFYGDVSFDCDGKIHAVTTTSDGENTVELGSYQPRQWYHVQVHIDLVSRLFDVYINGTLVGSGLQDIYEGTPKGIEVVSGHGGNPTAWFDDVKVWEGKPAPAKETTFTGSIPLPNEVSTDPKVIGTNVALALVLIVVFRFAAALFNDTIKANYEIIWGWISRVSGLFKPIIEFASRKTSGLSNVKARGYLKIALSVSLCALIYCYLDSYFSYDLKGLALFLSLALAIGIVTNCYEGGQSLFGRALYDIRSRFKIYPIAIFIAIVFVVFSRAINFHPGLIYGFVGGYVISLGPLKSDRADERGEVRKAAVLVLWGALLIVSIALLAFFLRAFVPQSPEGERSFWVSLADGILVGVFAGGLEGLFFSLVPLTFLDGAKITAWKWWVWPFVMAPVAFLFWHIILNREGTFSDVVNNMGAKMMWGLMGFFLLLSAVTWIYFRWRYKNKSREAEVTQPTTPAVAHIQYCPKCREAVSEGSNFCAKCGAPLSQSAE